MTGKVTTKFGEMEYNTGVDTINFSAKHENPIVVNGIAYTGTAYLEKKLGQWRVTYSRFNRLDWDYSKGTDPGLTSSAYDKVADEVVRIASRMMTLAMELRVKLEDVRYEQKRVERKIEENREEIRILTEELDALILRQEELEHDLFLVEKGQTNESSSV